MCFHTDMYVRICAYTVDFPWWYTYMDMRMNIAVFDTPLMMAVN